MRFNVGLYGGSFNPLHMGHVDAIIQAANMCKELYLVLSVGTKRDEIPELLRYRWLYQLTKHIGNVSILTIYDACESKAQYSDDIAINDAIKLQEQIGKPIDVVFVGDDYNQDSFWAKAYPKSQIYYFKRNGISSTKIRENPYEHWDELPDLVKPYYTKKVLIIGGESTGKSTLSINLKNRFNAAYIDEAGRELSFKSGTAEKMISEDFVEILLRQKMNEIEALTLGKKVLFEDTDTLITQFYIDFFDDPQAKLNKALSDAIDGLNRFDLILFLEPDVDFVQDGDRSLVIAAQRQKYSQKIKDLFTSHHKNFVSISGSYQERYEQAVKLVNELFKQNPHARSQLAIGQQPAASFPADQLAS